MNLLDLKNFLWKHGYFWKYDSGKNVKATDLHQLRLDDLPVVDAVRAWQESDANFSTLSRVVHSRAVIADGGIGPVTEAMLSVPRCPMPDFAPPEHAAVSSGNAEFDKAILSMREFATGSGSWKFPGCDPSGPADNHSIRVAIDTTRAPGTVKAYLDKALAENVKAYAEVGLAVRYMLHTGTGPDCEIDKKWEPMGGSVIGYNYFPQPNSCSRITGRFSTSYAPSDWRLWANLECHETGHGVGLQHGNGSIMNPSILLVWPMTWVGTYSFANLKRWFGGVPISGVPQPEPPPTGDYNGVFTYQGKLLKIRVWE